MLIILIKNKIVNHKTKYYVNNKGIIPICVIVNFRFFFYKLLYNILVVNGFILINTSGFLLITLKDPLLLFKRPLSFINPYIV